MAGARQGQNAGDNSQQLQAAGDIHVTNLIGVTEERARAIADESARAAVSEFSQEARSTAAARIARLEDLVIPRLVADGHLDALADPAVQITLGHAQMGAASSERESDYEMLASLIEDRVTRGVDDRVRRTAIDRAVEVIGQVDGSALTGLSAFVAVGQFTPIHGTVDMGMDLLNSLFDQILAGQDLPPGIEWVEHLDVLGVVRMVSAVAAPLTRLSQDWTRGMPGFVSPGLPAGSERAAHAESELRKVGVGVSILDHELRPGHVRLPITRSTSLDSALLAKGASAADIAEVSRIAKDLWLVDQREESLVDAFMEVVRARPSLRALEAWRDAIPAHFEVTPVGRLLARVNCDRLDTRGLLPPIDD